MGPAYSMTKTVRQATWGPAGGIRSQLTCCCYGREGKGGEGRTQVLDDQLPRGDNTRLVAHQGTAVLEDLAGGGVKQADAVEVGEARVLGDQGLGFLDGGIVGDVD